MLIRDESTGQEGLKRSRVNTGASFFVTPESLDLPYIYAKSGSEELVRLFQQHGVRFIVVGGTAVAFYGCRDPLEVDDFDVLIDPTIANAERVLAALASGFLRVPFDVEALARPRVQLPLKVLHCWADILTPEHSEFDLLFMCSAQVRIGRFSVRVIGRSDLIAMKERAIESDRPAAGKHQRDLQCLKAAP